jgi:hypothetical protein
MDCILNFMQFECHMRFHQKLSKLYDNYNHLNLMNFDRISNDFGII